MVIKFYHFSGLQRFSLTFEKHPLVFVHLDLGWELHPLVDVWVINFRNLISCIGKSIFASHASLSLFSKYIENIWEVHVLSYLSQKYPSLLQIKS